MNIKLFLTVFFIFNGAGIINALETNQGATNELPEIVVTANRYEQPLSNVGASISVINESDIQKKANQDVKDLIRDLPGVTLYQTGGFGGLSQVYIRGTEPGGTLVLIDGIPVNNPMSNDRSFDFADLTSDNIDRIEVIRGPFSTLYGSDAMGGVINIITKSGSGDPKAEIDAEAGSFNTFKYGGGVSGSLSNWNYSLYISHIQSDGFPDVTLSNSLNAPSRDGYLNTTISSKIGVRLFDGGDLNLVVHYNFADANVDDGAYEDDINHTYVNENSAAKLEFSHFVTDWWDYKASISYLYNRIEDMDYPNFENDDLVNSWYNGNNIKADLINNFHIQKIDTITIGADLSEEDGNSHYFLSNNYGPYTNDILPVSKTNAGIFAENQLKLFDSLINTSGFRADFSQIAGAVLNYSSSLLYSIPDTGLSLKGNIGTGYKEPTLFQLYSSYGDTNLKPEYSFGFDAGAVESFGEAVTLEIVYFQNRFNDLVTYDYNSSRYSNIDSALTEGVESSAKITPWDFLVISIGYTYTYAFNTNSGQYILYIPMHKASVNIDIMPVKNLFMEIQYSYYGTRYGYLSTDSPYVEMDDYSLVNLNFLLKLDRFDIYANVNNLFNTQYVEVFGYNTGGIMFNAGLKIKF